MRQENTYLDIILSPSRSLNAKGFAGLMGVLCLASLIIGGFFLSIGAWPVFGFFGLDILLLYWAFRTSFRDGTVQEHIVLDRDNLSITRRGPKETSQSHSLQPAWVQIILQQRIGRVERLQLQSHGKKVTIGSFLPPQELPLVADMIEAALRRRIKAMAGS